MQDRLDVRICVQLLVQITRNHFRIVVVAGLHATHARAGIGHGDEADGIEIDLLGAGIAVGFAGRLRIVVELDDLDVPVGPPFVELVGAGADDLLIRNRLGAGIGDDLRRKDRRTAIVEGH